MGVNHFHGKWATIYKLSDIGHPMERTEIARGGEGEGGNTTMF